MGDVEREKLFRNKIWTIEVCPRCACLKPHHVEPCLSDDPPGLRPLHQPYKVVSAKWREVALAK